MVSCGLLGVAAHSFLWEQKGVGQWGRAREGAAVQSCQPQHHSEETLSINRQTMREMGALLLHPEAVRSLANSIIQYFQLNFILFYLYILAAFVFPK